MAHEDFRQRLMPRFRETTADRVEKISSALLELERGAVDADGRQELVRELHTLKGEARMMGFVGLSSVVHAAEDLLKALPARGGKGPRLEALLAAFDAVAPLLDAPPDGGEPALALVERLRGLIGPAGRPPQGAPPPAPPPPREAPLRRSEDPKAELRGDRPAASIRVDVDRLDEIAALAGDVLVEGARSIRRSRELNGLFARWARLSDRVIGLTERLRDPGNQRLAEQIEGDVHLLRSDTFRFARQQSEAASTAHAQFGQLAERIGAARLIPLSGVLAGFPRAVRDMAREQAKEAGCVVKGAETGVDKAILLSLNDPLVHLVRNCVDHGLEPPEERERAGKPREGKVVITARTDGDLLALTVEDDGRGIDPALVRAVALRKGMIAEQQAAGHLGAGHPGADLPPRLHHPRAARRDQRPRCGARRGPAQGDLARRLGGGRVGAGQGGALHPAHAPVALAHEGAARPDRPGRLRPPGHRRGQRRPARARPTPPRWPASARSATGTGSCRWWRWGRSSPSTAAPRSKRPLVAYVWHGSEGAAVVVDGLHGEREVAVKAPGAFLKGMRFVTGAAALEDGRVALLLSTPDIVAAARRVATPSLSRARDRRRLRLLLVDDSAIAREAEAALLRSLGHEVDEAVGRRGGLGAAAGRPVPPLIADVQMPRLDGIDLIRRVKATARLARMPVLILSSLAAPEERRRGVDAGRRRLPGQGRAGRRRPWPPPWSGSAGCRGDRGRPARPRPGGGRLGAVPRAALRRGGGRPRLRAGGGGAGRGRGGRAGAPAPAPGHHHGPQHAEGRRLHRHRPDHGRARPRPSWCSPPARPRRPASGRSPWGRSTSWRSRAPRPTWPSTAGCSAPGCGCWPGSR